MTARIEPFDSFWEAPADIEKGFDTFRQILSGQLSQASPDRRGARTSLVISCGYGYFVHTS